MFCKNCGKEIGDDALFCPHCGAKTGTGSAEAPVQGQAEEVSGGMDERTSRYQEDKKKKNMMILIPIAALMLCLAIGLVAYVLLRDTGNEGAGNPNAAKETAAAESEPAGEEAAQSDNGEEVSGEEAAEAEVEYVAFNDEALEYAIRRETGIYDRGITTDEAAGIKELNLSGNLENEYGNITDLSGLSAFTGLKELDLSFNSVSDISELGALENLTALNLEKNRVEDITVLQNLTALRKLDLFTNFTTLRL